MQAFSPIIEKAAIASAYKKARPVNHDNPDLRSETTWNKSIFVRLTQIGNLQKGNTPFVI